LLKIFIISICYCFSLANFNPFFIEESIKEIKLKTIKPKIEVKEKIVYIKSKPKIKKPKKIIPDLKINYLGFISYKKKTFALIEINKKKLIIKKYDKLSINNKIIKIISISDRLITIKNSNKIQYINFSATN
jgi:hypothetical protein